MGGKESDVTELTKQQALRNLGQLRSIWVNPQSWPL